jgi:3'-5' exonuclease
MIVMQKNFLFLDIETVPAFLEFGHLPTTMKNHWTKKTERIWPSNQSTSSAVDSAPEDLYRQRAGIYAEFGKIICISVGLLVQDGGEQALRLKSFSGDDEKSLLHDFAQLLEKRFSDPNHVVIAGHNIKEFDIPYICRRMLVNQIALPDVLQLSGKKPWEVKHLADTMEMWRFGDIKNFTSLDLLAAILDIPSPKDDIDGSQVSEVYWIEKDLQRIVQYCEKDVLTSANVFLRLQGFPLITKTISV